MQLVFFEAYIHRIGYFEPLHQIGPGQIPGDFIIGCPGQIYTVPVLAQIIVRDPAFN